MNTIDCMHCSGRNEYLAQICGLNHFSGLCPFTQLGALKCKDYIKIAHPTQPQILWKCPKCGKETKTITQDIIQYCSCTFKGKGTNYTRMECMRGKK